MFNEESGYFRQVPGWDLNCAIVGTALAELSLISRIDTDMDSLILLDRTETGDPALDPILKAIAGEPAQHNAQYWIERLAPRAEAIVDLSLDRLVDLKILEHHEGDFWTLAPTAWQMGLLDSSGEGSAVEFVKTRISKVIFNNEIPNPRDVIIIALINTCDVFRFMFQLDDESEERIELVCRLDLIGRAIAEAVTQNMSGPLLRRSALSKQIPTVPLRKVVLHRNLRDGNLPALFADLAGKYGPVYQIKPPFQKPMIILAGPDTNYWAHRHGRMFLRGTTSRISRRCMAHPGYCLRWMAPIISGSARRWRRRIRARDSRGSWRISTTIPGHTWRPGRLETCSPRRACVGN